jgi:hypothetical protein
MSNNQISSVNVMLSWFYGLALGQSGLSILRGIGGIVAAIVFEI